MGSEKVNCEYFRFCVVRLIKPDVFLAPLPGRRRSFLSVRDCSTSDMLHKDYFQSRVLSLIETEGVVFQAFLVPKRCFRQKSTVWGPTIMNRSTSSRI